jgi:hypothetical protein
MQWTRSLTFVIPLSLGGERLALAPPGATPGKCSPGASSAFGTGAFLLAGSEGNRLAEHSSGSVAASRRVGR